MHPRKKAGWQKRIPIATKVRNQTSELGESAFHLEVATGIQRRIIVRKQPSP